MADTYFNLSKDYFNIIFEYKEGNLYWKQRPALCLKIGSLAGTVKIHDPYKRVQVCKKNLLQHRVIFFMHHGYLPEFVDHIDGNTFNNKIENLRPATRSQNCINRKIMSSNKSGYKNVRWCKTAKKWEVKMRVNNKNTYFGWYDDLQEAAKAAEKLRNEHYKEFARHK